MAQAWQASCGAAPELAFYGGSFTAIAPSLQEALLGAAAALVEKGAVSRIRLSTRPDALDDNVLARLAYYGVDTVEIGVQSLDELPVMRPEQVEDFKAEAEEEVQLRLDI